MSTPTTYAVRIEWDENACTLILATDTGRVEYRLDDPEQVYDAVMGGIWPWLYEREQAFKQFRARVNGGRLTDAGYENPRAYDIPGSAFACDPDESAGYALSDPKHPTFHDRMGDAFPAIVDEAV